MLKTSSFMLKTFAIIAVIGAALPATPVFASTALDRARAQECRSVLDGQPRIVRKEAVAAIGPGARITVRPLCIGTNIQDQGNAGGLHVAIAANPTLARALAREGWHGDDVVGIVITGHWVALYVHRL